MGTTKELQVNAISPTESLSEIETASVNDAHLRSAYRKSDLRLLYWYSFVYLWMRIHASNITNTAIINIETGDGIKTQLGNLTSGEWAWCLAIFYYPYAAFEPASTLLLKRFSPRVWMSRIMMTWGIVSMCQAATQNYSGLLATRFFLGLAEAGYYPGVLYHLTFWYPAKDTALRIAFFYACGQFSGTISGLLAFAISYMNGVGGLAGWRWVFILEGIPAVLMGIVTWFTLPNYPEDSAWLSEEEKRAVIDTRPKTQPSANAKTWNSTEFKAIFKDSRNYTYTFLWICHAIGGWGIAKVLPTVIYELGLSGSAVTQLLTMPCYTLGFIVLNGFGWLIHRGYVNAWLTVIGMEIVCVACYIALILVRGAVSRYMLVTIAIASSMGVLPILWPERIRAARGTTTAGLMIGFTNASAQLTGIVGPMIYQDKLGPRYTVSYSVSIALIAAAIVGVVVTWWLIWKRDQREAKEAESAELSSAQQSQDESS
ncbi:hypothetical protein CBER1_02173 [Cercospora berteroae]|uniref:Major facilitator superfamily (MFS) profile domain-containing protein n=1 Tax=Cercospora berteroae TaxID=357750 RepID=A0A2S6BQ98_9PEZI|nr:hypothetical protein CBER1_02173 [Cercospora berteroae]